MQCQRTDPVNHGKVGSSQEQTATHLSTRVGRDLGSPDQTVTQSEDMRPWTGPEGKQDPQRTLNIRLYLRIASICLSTILESVKDTRAYLLLATFNLLSLFIYFCLLFSFAPLRSIRVMRGEM